MPNIKIISYSNNPLETIYLAARQCYYPGCVSDMEIQTKDKMEKLIKRVISSGHTSVIEHVSFTFSISNFSRIISQQLLRHRAGVSPSQQSQRYCDSNMFNYIIPPKIEKNENLKKYYEEFMKKSQEAYKYIQTELDMLYPKQSNNEDARFVLPNSCETNIVITMNCRALLHFFEERLCDKAQWEIRELSEKMLDLVFDILPVVFDFAGPKCKRLKYCPENKTCGQFRRYSND